MSSPFRDTVDPEQRLVDLGIELPDFSATGYGGARFGPIAPHRLVGSTLFLSGHLPEGADGQVLHPGRLGDDLTVEQGYEAARLAGINAIAGMKFALGDLRRVAGIVRSLNYVVCTPDFHDTNLVTNGAGDLWRDVFGDIAGIGGRATFGIMSLVRRHCFETVVTVEVRS
jgi:enamine deaminase RidA (YjgF/YER057c/UK114 family)